MTKRVYTRQEGFDSFDPDEVPFGPLSWDKGYDDWMMGYEQARCEYEASIMQKEIDVENEEKEVLKWRLTDDLNLLDIDSLVDILYGLGVR